MEIFHLLEWGSNPQPVDFTVTLRAAAPRMAHIIVLISNMSKMYFKYYNKSLEHCLFLWSPPRTEYANTNLFSVSISIVSQQESVRMEHATFCALAFTVIAICYAILRLLRTCSETGMKNIRGNTRGNKNGYFFIFIALHYRVILTFLRRNLCV